jgi:hypothetical protein
VLISYSLWQRRYGRDPHIAGRTILMNGQGTTVLGVMPRDFFFPSREIDYWSPGYFTPQILLQRDNHFLTVVARMKPGAILINTSRGGVVDEAALIAALKAGRLAGAGLDVLQREPPLPDNPVLQMENVVLTPHYASTTGEALEDLARKVSRQIIQLLRGEWPTYLANPQVRQQPTCRLTAGRRTTA